MLGGSDIPYLNSARIGRGGKCERRGSVRTYSWNGGSGVESE